MNEDMFPQLTVKDLKKVIRHLPDSAPVDFLYRENLLSDKGEDYLYKPTVLWVVGKDTKRLTLVSIFAPEMKGN
ncbi:MAG: hypothetical protein NVS9B9_10300 [Ktedonobacteraceae bacterium]